LSLLVLPLLELNDDRRRFISPARRVLVVEEVADDGWPSTPTEDRNKSGNRNMAHF
jgi:hypothetical protein